VQRADGGRRPETLDVVTVGSAADGRTISEPHLDRSAWISLVTRNGSLVQIRGNTRLRAGDEVFALADSDVDLTGFFRAPPNEADPP